MGEATCAMPLTSVPGRAGVEPKLALAYDSAWSISRTSSYLGGMEGHALVRPCAVDVVAGVLRP
jgi:hypothetical protein